MRLLLLAGFAQALVIDQAHMRCIGGVCAVALHEAHCYELPTTWQCGAVFPLGYRFGATHVDCDQGVCQLSYTVVPVAYDVGFNSWDRAVATFTSALLIILYGLNVFAKIF